MQKLLPYFSFAGRANRQAYWVTTILVNVTTVVVVFAATGLGTLGFAVIALATLASLWLACAVGARRLHDRNRSAWWLLAMYSPLFLLPSLAMIASASSPEAERGLNILSLPFSLWTLVDLGILKGTSGPNRFGADPLQSQVAEVFS